jgi:Ca-activated chloride channel family protein
LVNLPDITFLWPAMLILLGLVPLCIGLYLLLQRRRQRIQARFMANDAALFGKFSLAQLAPAQGPGRRRHIPPALFLLSLTILLIALARPQANISLPRVQGTVILAFDVSGSMAADDIEPSRMEAAKAAAGEFVQRQPGSVQIGVVAFSGNGFSVQPPTNDQQEVLASIDRLKPELSTSLGHGILVSLDTIDQLDKQPQSADNESLPTPTPVPLPEGTFSPAVIVLLTDGENTAPPDPIAAALTAAERGVRIYTVGIGSPSGKTLQINGFNVHTQLDEAMLQQIALLTGGAYFHAGTEEDLRTIYQELRPQLVIRSEKMEVTSLLAGVGMLTLLVGSAFSLAWFNRLP